MAALQVKAKGSGVESLPHDVQVGHGVRLFGIGGPQRADVGTLRLP